MESVADICIYIDPQYDCLPKLDPGPSVLKTFTFMAWSSVVLTFFPFMATSHIVVESIYTA